MINPKQHPPSMGSGTQPRNVLECSGISTMVDVAGAAKLLVGTAPVDFKDGKTPAANHQSSYFILRATCCFEGIPCIPYFGPNVMMNPCCQGTKSSWQVTSQRSNWAGLWCGRSPLARHVPSVWYGKSNKEDTMCVCHGLSWRVNRSATNPGLLLYQLIM